MEYAKKKAAAISAVLNYIRTEEETAAERTAAAFQWTPPGEPVPLWSLSGRQSQMQIRHLMNMKTFHGTKFR